MNASLPQLPQGIASNPQALEMAINDRLRRISQALDPGTTGAAATPVGGLVVYGTHAERVNRAVPADATIYVETDRSNVEYQARGTQWAFVAGLMVGPWADLPTDLGPGDANFVFFDDTDSLHVWQWTGIAWTWGPGDRHSGEFGQFDADPGTGWHLCNGSINQTKYSGDGTRVTNFTVPDQREFYLQASATYTGAGVAAVAPALTGSTASGNAAIGLGNANIGNDTDAGASLLVTAGATNVALNPHVHLDSGHAHADAGHTHGKGTLAAGAAGTPPTFAVLPYYRL